MYQSKNVFSAKNWFLWIWNALCAEWFGECVFDVAMHNEYMIAICEHMNYGKNCCFYVFRKKKTKSKRIKILNEEEEKKLRFLTRDRSITKKNITRKIVETIKIEAFSKPELCVRNVCFVWIDLNVSHQSGKNSFFSVVHIYTYMFLLLVVYTCGDRLIRVNNWPR